MISEVLLTIYSSSIHHLVDLVSHVCGTVLVMVGKLVFAQLVGSGAIDIQVCDRESCPGSAYNLITVAWANIGYMTHSDFLHFLWNTGFGTWAILLYVVGAGGALISVALNNPPKAWVWFFLGPPIYSFLIATTEPVKGVAWRIAGVDQKMEAVWRDAETGLANTELVQRTGIQVSRKEAPSQPYQVAWMLVFLDGLFSDTSQRIIGWIGMQRREGRGGTDSNLFNKENEEGPWHLLANLKWGMVENIAGVTARDPDVRDALVTFLTSECGDQFKRGVHSGAYSAASQARGGAEAPNSVFVGTGNGAIGAGRPSYTDFVRAIDTEIIPTPRSLVRLFNSPKNQDGSFRQFSSVYSGDQAYTSGRITEIVCSEYLYTIIQALRWEAGHSYWQLVRSFPYGIKDEESALKTLFYGWNLRKDEDSPQIEGQELKDYTKHLIFLYLLRNELMLAPQVTEVSQRFAPSEQTRNFTESYVRSQGSRSKYGELYNWAVMMPHVQGVLTYLILIGYPFAVMLMVIPGYWKAFFTWVTFFAWVKLWDVGFAIVHTLERSVWAIIGNHSSMARVANKVLKTIDEANSKVNIGLNCTVEPERLPLACPIPDVKEASTLSQDDAWLLFDRALALSGSLDLDLSNGYYIYIMAALYFAVPAVTGQLVLGAKAGMAGLATDALGKNAGEAGGAAKSGLVGEMTNRVMTNRDSLNQAAGMKSMRKSGLALQHFDNANAAMGAEIESGRIGGVDKALGSVADARGNTADSHKAAGGEVNSAIGLWGKLKDPTKASAEGTGEATGQSPLTQGAALAGGAALGALGGGLSRAGALTSYGIAAQTNDLSQAQLGAKAAYGAMGLDNHWTSQGVGLGRTGFQAYGGRLQAEANFLADQDAWEAKNAFATHMSGIGGVAGVNPGNLAPGQKPTGIEGFALTGSLGADAQTASRYSGFGFMSAKDSMVGAGRRDRGSSLYMSNWRPFSTVGVVGGAHGTFVNRGASVTDLGAIANTPQGPSWIGIQGVSTEYGRNFDQTAKDAPEKYKAASDNFVQAVSNMVSRDEE